MSPDPPFSRRTSRAVSDAAGSSEFVPEPRWVTTAMGFDGHRIVKHRGVVRDIVVPSRSIVGSLGAGLQTLFGGNITLPDSVGL